MLVRGSGTNLGVGEGQICLSVSPPPYTCRQFVSAKATDVCATARSKIVIVIKKFFMALQAAHTIHVLHEFVNSKYGPSVRIRLGRE